MIKRINLIEKQVFAFTYLMLAKICLGVVLSMALFTGYQFYKVYRANKDIAAAQVKLDALKTEQKKLKAKPVKEKISIGEYQALLDRMESAPEWSRILQDISFRLPKSVWITSFKTLDASANTVAVDRRKKKKPDDKTVEKAPEIVHRVEVSGNSSDVRNVSEFLASLSKSDFFRNLSLSDSKKEENGYSFVIKSEARSDVK